MANLIGLRRISTTLTCLIHSIEGVALSPDKGGPFRLMIPEDVADAPPGCANVKGVVRIVVRAERT